MLNVTKNLFAVLLIGLAALGANRVLSYTDADERIKEMVGGWLATKRSAGPAGHSVRTELSEAESRLRQIAAEKASLAAAVEASDREAGRLANILARTSSAHD
jgi:hypothetical protein